MMKMTRHNGRSGKNGAYNPKHNDRSFNLENSGHIDTDRVKQNIYWDCLNGYRNLTDSKDDSEMSATFEDVERIFYENRYGNFVKGQNARNEKNRHTERNRTTEQIRQDKKTCPEETIYQIGTMEEHAPPDVLFQVVTEFITEIDKRFGSHVHTLDWALHLDESSPHIHERHVFDCENKYGELCPQQEKALEALGFDLPEPDKKPGRYNNRKMVFDSACRALLFDIARKHGLHLEEQPEYGGRKYLEKQDFILMKQKEKIAEQEKAVHRLDEKISGQEETLISQHSEIERNAGQIVSQEERLDELSMKIEDAEILIEDVSAAAYDKAVDIVTEKVRIQTQQEDIIAIADYKKKLNLPEAKINPKVLLTVNKVLDNVQSVLKNAARQIQKKISNALKAPEARSVGVEQVKEKARESIYDVLRKNKVKADQQNEERRARQSGQQTRKKDMEL